MVAMFCLSVEYGVAGGMVAVLLRKTLGASEWQTLVATSCVSIMSLLAIFWNEVYRRVNTGRYLLLLWALAILPLSGIAFFSSPGPVLACLLVSALGTGGIQSIAADILRSCYPPISRGRIFSVLKTIEQLVIMVTALSVGFWLDHNHYAYRIYFPLSVGVVGVGFLLLYRISRQPLFQERLRQQQTARPLGASLRGAYQSMLAVLKKDAAFRAYETAFCAYGIGWMMCYALMPFLVADILHLDYKEVAWSTQVVVQLTTLLTLMPGGLLLDRIGPIRLSAWTFAFLVVYPIGLLFVWNVWSLMAVTVLYGIGMMGVNLSWTIGPVTLARDASHAPHYLAIHATLVAVRGLLGQFPAVAWYYFSGQIRPPIAAAGLLFLIGALLMARLDRRLRDERESCTGARPLPKPAETARAADAPTLPAESYPAPTRTRPAGGRPVTHGL